MPITDVQAAALRAQLAGEPEEHNRLLDQMGENDQKGYSVLLAAAFYEAVERRFGSTVNRAAIIEFVGDVRSRAESIAERLPADVAEQMLMHALDDEVSISDLDDSVVVTAQVLITASIIGDEQLSDEQLDAFIAEVRAVADRFL